MDNCGDDGLPGWHSACMHGVRGGENERQRGPTTTRVSPGENWGLVVTSPAHE